VNRIPKSFPSNLERKGGTKYAAPECRAANWDSEKIFISV
jgi:hypothetical protein